MGVYSMNASSTNELDINLEGATEIECKLEAGIVAAYNIVAESENNFNAIMQAVGVAELAVYESTGTEMVYEAADVRGFFATVKKFFVNLWEKIKGLFTKFFSMFDSFVKSDKEFVNKYRTHLLKINMKDFKFKGFKFDNLKFDVEAGHNKAVAVFTSKGLGDTIPSSIGDIEKALTASESKEDMLESMRAAGIGHTNTYTASEFSKELFKFFRSGEDAKEELEGVSISDQLTHISANSDLKKAAEKSYKELEKIIKEAITAVDKQEKALVKLVPTKGEDSANKLHAASIRFASTTISFMKDAANVAQLVNGAKLTAIKDQNRQAKSICVSAMNYSPKNESTDLGGSFLSNVVLK